MKNLILSLLMFLTLWPACGQSTIIYSTADSLILKRYLSNTAAIRDSLIRFEYTKLRFASSQSDFFDLSTRYSALSTQYSSLITHSSSLTTQNSSLSSDLSIAKKKLKSANGEKWGWRILAGVAAFAVIKSHLSP